MEADQQNQFFFNEVPTDVNLGSTKFIHGKVVAFKTPASPHLKKSFLVNFCHTKIKLQLPSRLQLTPNW